MQVFVAYTDYTCQVCVMPSQVINILVVQLILQVVSRAVLCIRTFLYKEKVSFIRSSKFNTTYLVVLVLLVEQQLLSFLPQFFSLLGSELPSHHFPPFHHQLLQHL